MKTFTLKVDADIAGEMLEFLEGQRTALLGKLKIVESNIEKVKAASPRSKTGSHQTDIRHILITREIKTSEDHPRDSIPLASLARAIESESNRRKKPYGAARQAVITFLKSRNGAGASMKEVIADAQVSYGSAYRYLHAMRAENMVSENEGLWKWIGQQ